MRGIMPAIIDQAGRKSTLTKVDGVSRRHRRLQASGKGRQRSRAATESRFEVLPPESARRDDPDYRLAQLRRRDSVGGLPS
jgi:hypothetical protein